MPAAIGYHKDIESLSISLVRLEVHEDLRCKVFLGKREKRTRAKSSYGTCNEARRAKSQELIWYELKQNSEN